MNNTEEINILWEGPFNIEEIQGNKIDSTKYDVKSNSIGLYQIYGSHPLYGNGVLVYIGRTQDGFNKRLKKRWVIENGNDSENIKIYLGTIYCDSCKLEEEDIHEKIKKSESILINAMKPAFNSSNIQSTKEESSEDRFIVYNVGDYRSLYPILDSNYFWKDPKNYAIVDKLANEFNIKVEEGKDNSYGFYLNKKEEYSYSIWFGVDYEIWDKLKIPLTFQIYFDEKNTIEELDDFKLYKYECDDSDFEDTLYKGLNIKEFNKKGIFSIEKFKKHVDKIRNMINKYGIN